MKGKLFQLLLIFTLSSSFVYSQESKRIGISGSIQNSEFGISVPIWLGEKFAIAPSFSLKIAEKVGTDFGIALAPRFYFKREIVAPYFGLKVGALINKPSSGNQTSTETDVDFVGGMAFGGEYFLSENFSFGVEIQGNVTKSGKNSYRFGNPDRISFNTGTMVSATLYF
jgi:hypothetical protein